MSRNKRGIAFLLDDEAECEDSNNYKQVQLSTDNEEEVELKKLSGFVELGYSKTDDDKTHNLIMREMEKDENYLAEIERRKKFPPKVYHASKRKDSVPCKKQTDVMMVKVEQLQHSRLLRLMCDQKNSAFSNSLSSKTKNSKSKVNEELGAASKERMNEYLEQIENEKRKEACLTSTNFKKAFEKKLKQNTQIIKKLSINLNDPAYLEKNQSSLVKSIIDEDEDQDDGEPKKLNIIRGMWLISQQNSLLNYRKSNTQKTQAPPKQSSKRVKTAMLYSIFHNTQQGRNIKQRSDLISRGDLLMKFAHRNSSVEESN